MANEAVLINELEPQIPFTVADTTAITKGSLLKLTDPCTAIISSAANDMIAGIAGSDKIASDGTTILGVYRYGVFKMTASGSITVGQALASAATDAAQYNKVYVAPATASGSQIVGIALETATTGETLKVLLNVGCGGNGVA